MIAEESVYKIGQITRTHGVKGEVAFMFTDDVWDRADSAYLILRIDGILVPFFMEEYRFRGNNAALVKFLDYESSEDARELCGTDVYFPYALTPEVQPDDEFAWNHFTGFRVEDENAGYLGEIDHVDDTTTNVLFYVGDLMIPAVEEFVVEIDHGTRTVKVLLPSELLNLNE